MIWRRRAAGRADADGTERLKQWHVEWILSRRLPNVVGPRRHQLSPSLDQIATPTRSLAPVNIDMRQCEIADLARRVGTLRPQSRKLERKPESKIN